MPTASGAHAAAPKAPPAPPPPPPHSGATARPAKPVVTRAADVFSGVDAAPTALPAALALPSPEKTIPSAPETPKRKKKTAVDIEYTSLKGLGEDRLIDLLKDRDVKHRELLERFNESKKENLKTQQLLRLVIEKMGMSAPPSTATNAINVTTEPASSPDGSNTYASIAAKRLPLPPQRSDFEAQRAQARSALAPVRRPSPRVNPDGVVVSPPKEDLTPIWIKIARLPTKSLRGHLRLLGIPTSLIHDYSFVRENTLQVIAVKNGRDRLVDSFRREEFVVFETFDPTRPRSEDASAKEHEYARSSFRRQVANSIEHARSRGREGVADYYAAWLARAEEDWAKKPLAAEEGAPTQPPVVSSTEAAVEAANRC
ncbi:hypothetical protein CF326_g2383 [Tilletia indica]|nr:hypothetical protein CF326_g2383 [Tilletia indica]